jgi:hypothetical protein
MNIILSCTIHITIMDCCIWEEESEPNIPKVVDELKDRYNTNFDHLISCQQGGYVFLSHEYDWILVLEKVDNTRTNENRKTVCDPEVVDDNYVMYTGDQFLIVDIVHKFDSRKIWTDLEAIKRNHLIKSSTYEHDLKDGIHYFKSYLPAFFYGLRELNGTHLSWHADSGHIHTWGEYKYGIPVKTKIWNFTMDPEPCYTISHPDHKPPTINQVAGAHLDYHWSRDTLDMLKSYQSKGYVFKSYGKHSSKDDWIIVLKRTPDTITNEGRSRIRDEEFASYKASELEVVDILKKYSFSDEPKDLIPINEFGISLSDREYPRYEKGRVMSVGDKYDPANEEIDSGIVFYRTYVRAFYENYQLWDGHGDLYYWYPNGILSGVTRMMYGELHGIMDSWYPDGRLQYKREFKHGVNLGEYIINSPKN